MRYRFALSNAGGPNAGTSRLLRYTLEAGGGDHKPPVSPKTRSPGLKVNGSQWKFYEKIYVYTYPEDLYLANLVSGDQALQL